jgi:hypothetical protein
MSATAEYVLKRCECYGDESAMAKKCCTLTDASEGILEQWHANESDEKPV